MRNQSWHHGITSSLGPICMWLETKFSSAADVIWQTCISDVDWQDFLLFPHIRHPGHTAGLGEPGHVRNAARTCGAGEENNSHPGAAHGSDDTHYHLQPALHQPTLRNSNQCDIYRVNTHSKQILQIACRRSKQGNSSFNPSRQNSCSLHDCIQPVNQLGTSCKSWGIQIHLCVA